MSMSPRVTIGLAAMGMLTSSLAEAGTIRVPKDHPTIQAAIDAAQDGDTIAIAKGTYAPFVVSGRSGLRLKGKGKPVVDGQGLDLPAVVDGSQDVTVDGLVLRNSSQYGMRILGSDRITVRRCIIQDTPDDGLELRDGTGLLIEKNRFEHIAEDGIDFEDGSDDLTEVTDSRLSKNRFDDIEGGAILIEGRGILAEKNRVARTEIGIAIDNEAASDNTIAKNRIEETGDAGIEVEGTQNVVEKNRLRRTGDAAIRIRADETRIEKNRIDAVGDEGIDLEGSDNRILRNVVTRSAGSGMEIGNDGSPGASTGNLVERNKILGAGGDGIYIEDTDNVFRRNKVKKSAGADLHDTTGPDGNAFEDNKFGTEDFS